VGEAAHFSVPYNGIYCKSNSTAVFAECIMTHFTPRCCTTTPNPHAHKLQCAVLLLFRHCNESNEQQQQLAGRLRALQQEVAELQEQLVRSEEHQQAAAAQMSQVLSINRNLQVGCCSAAVLLMCF
jgi:septal ring factor EnvC (AmiA/AmiB activator)